MDRFFITINLQIDGSNFLSSDLSPLVLNNKSPTFSGTFLRETE